MMLKVTLILQDIWHRYLPIITITQTYNGHLNYDKIIENIASDKRVRLPDDLP